MISDADTGLDSLRVQQVHVSAYEIPTDAPEADGTLRWNSTTLVLVEVDAGGKTGIGYTYADLATAYFIEKKLKPLLHRQRIFNIPAINALLVKHIRNSGGTGIAMMAISAIDSALWDLKGKVLNLPLCKLLGQAKEAMLLYGSGGFTSYTKAQLQAQFHHWAEEGMMYFKMKIGGSVREERTRMQQAREVMPADAELFIDANGAYHPKQALLMAQTAADFNVTWFEEPVSSDDVAGLKFLKEHAPAGMNIASGEYGYNLSYFRNLLQAGAIDVLQADATRCGGITGFLKAGSLAEAFHLPFSSHCAPALHLHAAVSLPSFYIAEYFHDHVRIENMLFDGVSPPVNGELRPDLQRPGLGFDFKYADAKKFQR